jgi:hypothetical protein
MDYIRTLDNINNNNNIIYKGGWKLMVHMDYCLNIQTISSKGHEIYCVNLMKKVIYNCV